MSALPSYRDRFTGQPPPVVRATAALGGAPTVDAAIRLVDDREIEARQRFEQLKSEMTGRAAISNVVRRDGGEM